MWSQYCNSTLGDMTIIEVPDWRGFTFHLFALFGTLALLIASCVISLYLMTRHATHYSKPWEQRHILRILFVVPVYSIVSFCGELYYREVVYFETAWNVYEAFVIASFFALACSYVAPTLREQKAFFADLEPKDWIWPLSWVKPCVGGDRGLLKRPTNGLIWINILWIGIFQYCLVKVLLSVVAVTLQVLGRYCSSSDSPVFGHIYILVIEGISVTVSKYCLLANWKTMKPTLCKVRKTARLQLICIMLVVYLTFWQNLLFTLLFSTSGPVAASRTVSYQDLNIGLPIVILNLEMLVYSIMHINAYNWKDYRRESENELQYHGFFHAVWDACNPWDIIKAVGRSVRLLWVGHGAWVKSVRTEDDFEGAAAVELASVRPKYGDRLASDSALIREDDPDDQDFDAADDQSVDVTWLGKPHEEHRSV